MSWHEIPQDALGFAAGVLTTVAFVPQVYRIVKTRSAHDISWLMFGIFSAGIVLWLWYGIRVGALPLIVANAVTLALAAAILFLKWRYGRDSLPHPWRRWRPRPARAQSRHADAPATIDLAPTRGPRLSTARPRARSTAATEESKE